MVARSRPAASADGRRGERVVDAVPAESGAVDFDLAPPGFEGGSACRRSASDCDCSVAVTSAASLEAVADDVDAGARTVGHARDARVVAR